MSQVGIESESLVYLDNALLARPKSNNFIPLYYTISSVHKFEHGWNLDGPMGTDLSRLVAGRGHRWLASKALARLGWGNNQEWGQLGEVAMEGWGG